MAEFNRLQSSGSFLRNSVWVSATPWSSCYLEHGGKAKAKAIGSNPLADFLVQIGCGAVVAMGLGYWGKPLEARGLITG